MANYDIKGEKNPKWSGGGFISCPICGTKTWKKPYQIKRERLFCSRKCGYKGRNNSQISNSGELHPNWKGDNVSYFVLHKWVRKNKVKTGICLHCSFNKRTYWANKSHLYERNLNDWIELCSKCHHKYDSETGWGLATKKFNL